MDNFKLVSVMLILDLARSKLYAVNTLLLKLKLLEYGKFAIFVGSEYAIAVEMDASMIVRSSNATIVLLFILLSFCAICAVDSYAHNK